MFNLNDSYLLKLDADDLQIANLVETDDSFKVFDWLELEEYDESVRLMSLEERSQKYPQVKNWGKAYNLVMGLDSL